MARRSGQAQPLGFIARRMSSALVTWCAHGRNKVLRQSTAQRSVNWLMLITAQATMARAMGYGLITRSESVALRLVATTHGQLIPPCGRNLLTAASGSKGLVSAWETIMFTHEAISALTITGHYRPKEMVKSSEKTGMVRSSEPRCTALAIQFAPNVAGPSCAHQDVPFIPNENAVTARARGCPLGARGGSSEGCEKGSS